MPAPDSTPSKSSRRAGLTVAGKYNYRHCSIRVTPPRPFAPGVHPGRAAAILVSAQKWVNGTEITYAFFKGPEPQKAAMRTAFNTWKGVGIGIRFREVLHTIDSMMRIAFADDGSWSYIGREILTIPKAEATLNIGWDITSDLDTGVHEIGHTLGLPHEHQNPNAGIVWNETAVYNSLAQPPNSWDHDKTFHNIIEKINPDSVQGSKWDPNSIMHYPFEPGLILKPKKYRNGLTPAGGLSVRDKKWIKTFYPALNDDRHPALIPMQSTTLTVPNGHQANYRIEPESSGTYEVRTFGPIDSVMVLFQRDGTKLTKIAADDDSGDDKNASIKVQLVKGTKYILRVRVMYTEPDQKASIMLW